MITLSNCLLSAFERLQRLSYRSSIEVAHTHFRRDLVIRRASEYVGQGRCCSPTRRVARKCATSKLALRATEDIETSKPAWQAFAQARALARALVCALCLSVATFLGAAAESRGAVDPVVESRVSQGLEWLAVQQHKLGHWTAQGRYPTAMTSLAGLAFLCEGSTTTQGKYAENVRRAVDFLSRRSRDNGLIGDFDDERYTYGHGFAMLFLSQVLGEEEDLDRRRELTEVLTKAVVFTGQAQTRAGGWGYVSAKDGNGFDEGSTTITQVQGLRGCRNAGIPVPKEIIDNAVGYIHKCTDQKDGGVHYSSKGGGSRPAITAAAVACLYNAGEYDDTFVPKMLEYCHAQLKPNNSDSFGHWHYAHFYYAQVMYREGADQWEEYIREIRKRMLREAEVIRMGDTDVAVWKQGYIGPVYTTALNLIIMQLDKAYLPIYQR